MKFQVGDIVECLVDSPSGARIYKGELGIIEQSFEGGIRFKNYPEHTVGGLWAGQADDFTLYTVSLENE